MSDAELVTMTADEYHADPCDTPSLSSSIAGILVSRSPRHAYLAHPRLGGVRRESTKSMDRGTLIHALVLGKGAEIVAVDAADWRTKAAQEQRDAIRAAHKVPVLVGDYNEALTAAASIEAQLGDRGIWLTGQSEVVAKWIERADDGTPVRCRAMIDHLMLPAIFDLKTCRSAHPAAIQRHVIGYGYHIQAHAYQRAVAAVDPTLTGRTDFVFLFVELDPAVTVQPARLDGSMRVLGERQWRRAVNTWAACLTSGRWPAYSDDTLTIEAPPWALQQDFDADLLADAS